MRCGHRSVLGKEIMVRPYIDHCGSKLVNMKNPHSECKSTKSFLNSTLILSRF